MESVVPVPPRTLWPHIRRGHGGAPEADPPGVRLLPGGAGPAVGRADDTPSGGPDSDLGASPWVWGPPQGQGHQVQEFRTS